MGKIISNGINYSGLINAQGVFIDTNNVIQASTNWTTSMSYTATQDCFVVIENDAQSSHFKATIDGVEIYDYGTSGQYVCIKQPFAVKKGQVFGATTNQSNTLSYTVYGIQQGSTSGILDYSTNEQFTGQHWIDGKPIYQKTYVKVMEAYSTSDDGYVIARDLTNVDNVIDINGTIKVATGLHVLENSFINVSGFSMLSSYEFAIHLNDSGVLLLWTGNTSYGSGVVGNTAMITVKYTKKTT